MALPKSPKKANGTRLGGPKSGLGTIKLVQMVLVCLIIVGTLCWYILTLNMMNKHNHGRSRQWDDLKHQFITSLHRVDIASEPIASRTNVTESIMNQTVNSKNRLTTQEATKSPSAAPTQSLTKEENAEVQGYLPLGLQNILDRAIHYQHHCNTLNSTNSAKASTRRLKDGGDANKANMVPNRTDIPNFGIINALSNYRPQNTTEDEQWRQCTIPPPTECNETKFTVIFMAYNPERLRDMYRMIARFTDQNTQEWTDLVHEVIVVWNGARNLTKTTPGKQLLKTSETRNVRLVYPLKMGYPNDLMNRYNPDVLKVQTKALLYYDDDGPFYSVQAILSGFELWKRNANAQIGAMARRLDVSPRQVEEKTSLFEGLSDLHFVSHCRANGDSLFYNYYTFANFGANMVLPSGSFLHSNFLCFLWHPALEEFRQFIRDDAVHPDDAATSMIVSQVGGRAPRVYSRRIRMEKRRRLREAEWINKTYIDSSRRKLLWEQENWGDMRKDAVNSIAAYFGSLNSGSLGWCYGTEYHKKTRKGDEVCDPEMAKIGMIPWLSPKHEPLDTCP